MGSTANRAIPYVEPSDLLQTYPTQDKAQADRLDALLFDTGWVDITVAAGFAPSSDKPQLRRIGSVVYARGAWTSTGMNTNSNHTIGTIPTGFWQSGLGTAVIAGGSSAATIAQPTAVLFNLGSGSILCRTSATLPSWIYINALTYMLS